MYIKFFHNAIPRKYNFQLRLYRDACFVITTKHFDIALFWA